MYFAHMPAGYLITKLILRNRELPPKKYYTFLALGMFASISPDIGLIYQHFFDSDDFSHHYYWTHIPFIWVVGFLALREFFVATDRREYIFPLLIFTICGLSHIVLDTAGGVRWLYPFDQTMFFLMTHMPPCRHDILHCFMMNWSFLLEIFITATAGIVYLMSKNRNPK